ncbi:FadR/GntR family transcriptional regulator [Streptomyces sp. NPDC015171]|uniref:FadR/GntR family transcriptional regulator n=1 Tax=Streptomyces sp. NPDC015171 TaxID=3364945 RepID=UPI0036F58B94
MRRVGRGTFVASAADRDEAGGGLQTSPAEIMAARLLLEPELTALAARHATPADLDRMRHCATRSAGAGTHEEFESWDGVLHRSIAQGAHNTLLLQMFDVMNAARSLPVWGNIKRRSASPARRAGYEQAHRLIIEALADRDPDTARDHMRAHLIDVRLNLLGPN